MTLYRFSFCPPSHYHATAQDAANCSELEFAFGPLHPVRLKRGRAKCTVQGCADGKVYQSAYCATHRRQALKQNKARRGSW